MEVKKTGEWEYADDGFPNSKSSTLNLLFSFFLGDVKPCLFAVVALLMVKLAERMGKRLVISGPVAEHVDSRIYCLTERTLVGDVLPCYVIGRAVVWRSAHKRQPGCKVDAVAAVEGLERSQALVVIHGKNAVKRLVRAFRENPSAAYGPKA